MTDMVNLHLGDCLEILPTLAADSVDAVVTDPPYGIGESNNDNGSRSCLAQSKDYGKSDWDNQRVPDVIPEIFRVSDNQVIFGGNYYADLLPPSMGWIVWDKHNGRNDFSDCELAWTSYQRALRQIDWTWHGMIRQGNEKRYHPTQKPLGVMRWIVENYSNPGDTILDPFMGSGTTGVACMQTNRSFIGIEIEPKYYEIAEARIAEAQLQMRLPI